MAVEYSLLIEKGATWTFSFVHRNKTTKAPYDLSGCRAWMEIKSVSGGNPLTLTTENGHIEIDGPAGKVSTTMPPTETSAVTLKNGRYELFVVYPDDTVKKRFYGSIRAV
jgi:hypothetical protein